MATHHQPLLFRLLLSYLRLDGGWAAEEGRSSSSLARLLPLLLGAAPRFAEDMLERNGGELKMLVSFFVVKRGRGRCPVYRVSV
jgi:hypothetical protein